MTRRSLFSAARLTRALGFAVAVAGSAGCGPAFDPPSEIKSLRVLGVQKDKPYANPGEEVNLSILWHDGSPEAGSSDRTVEVLWLGGCFNPIGDLYSGCFADPSGFEPEVGGGDDFAFTMPSDIIASRPPPPDPRQPPYGLSYVFFAVCAGQIDLALDGREGFPLRCSDAAGRELGADDFVIGYTGVYAFEDYDNQNPIVTGMTFRGRTIPGSCVDPISAERARAAIAELPPEERAGAELGGAAPPVCASGESAPPENPCAEPNAACVPRCEEDGDPLECTEYSLRALVARESAESDEVSRDAYGRDFEEQMWINHYVTRGALRGDGVRLLNDASTGWNDDYGTKFYAPKDPGPVDVWAVVHDNRGGSGWAKTTIWIE